MYISLGALSIIKISIFIGFLIIRDKRALINLTIFFNCLFKGTMLTWYSIKDSLSSNLINNKDVIIRLIKNRSNIRQCYICLVRYKVNLNMVDFSQKYISSEMAFLNVYKKRCKKLLIIPNFFNWWVLNKVDEVIFLSRCMKSIL